MNTPSSIELKPIGTAVPELDSKLSGGLRRGSITELVGQPDLSGPVTAHLLERTLSAGAKIGLIDCAHDLGDLNISFSKLDIVQPSCIRELPLHLNRYASQAFDFVVINLGAEVWHQNGILQSAVDENLQFTLWLADATVLASNLACLVVAEWSVMPTGPTVIRPYVSDPQTGRAGFIVIRALEFKRPGLRRLG